jgi:hypothetical protein
MSAQNMSLPRLQYRNNDPSENVQVNFTDLGGRERVLSFVATRPHWCEEQDIYGDLFDVTLEKVFEGDAYPVPPASAEEGELVKSFRDFVYSAVERPERYRQLSLREIHFSLKTDDQMSSLGLVWFLGALEKRRERYTRQYLK